MFLPLLAVKFGKFGNLISPRARARRALPSPLPSFPRKAEPGIMPRKRRQIPGQEMKRNGRTDKGAADRVRRRSAKWDGNATPVI